MWAWTVILSNAEIQTGDNSQPVTRTPRFVALQFQPSSAPKDHRTDKIGIFLKVEFKPSRKFLIGNIILCNFIFWKHVNIWLWDPSLPQLFLNISEQQIELPPALTVVPHITSQHYCGTKPVITLPQCLTSWLWIKQCLHNLFLLSFSWLL